MNTTQLKSFAAEARKSLLSGVKSKMNALGFKDNGTVDERDYPMQAPDGTLFQGEIYDVSFYGKWMRLKDEIDRYGFRQVCEEGAYTWFNRLMAIQILSRNGLIDPVLEFESPDVRIPLMVKQAHEGICPEMTVFDAARLNAVIDDDNRITDQFAILIVAYCQSTPILYKCFGTLNDFTELQLPTNILASNGFMNLLNGSTFITQDDYETTELIGWLYQFYISERKDEVFASFKSGHKADANDIPAATQIFTPNWIVKYMVQNTLGRIYLDNNPDSPLKDSWQYLVEAPSGEAVIARNEAIQESPTEQPNKLKLTTIEDLTFADLSCGSGHILGEAFDMLFEIYKEEGYTRRQAIKAIFQRNLLGIDIDTRAKQLATFTLMLKACQQWPDAISCEVMPRVLDMPQPDDPICERYPIMKQAHNLGSIMKIEPMEGETHPLVKALTDRYAAVVMNPPYMGSGNMNGELAKYVKDNYEDEKADLFAVFMKVAEDHLLVNAKYGMINMQSWMFLSSFEKLRTHVIEDLQIDNMLHLGPRTFDEIGGEVVQNTAFVITNTRPSHNAYYFRLVDFTPSDTKKDNFKNCCRHIRLNGDISKMKINLSQFCFNVHQSNFKNIPGNPIGYWISKNMTSIISSAAPIDNTYKCREGLHTTDNKKYVRLWPEVNNQQIAFNCNNYEEVDANGTWVPYNKGGGFRRWYGLNDYIVAFNKRYRDEMAGQPFHVRPSEDLYFKEGGTWSAISTGKFAIRYYPKGFMFDAGGQVAVGKDIIPLIAYLNSNLFDVIAKLTMPTINFKCGVVKTLPNLSLVSQEHTNKVALIEDITKENIQISKQDWDAHETSWDFEENELVRMLKEGRATDLETAVEAYKEEWEEKFNQLHDNEEELNRQFIEIYGLEDELTPVVPLEEVTILQQGEISIENK